jgi:uracil-DNA glycosylase
LQYVRARAREEVGVPERARAAVVVGPHPAAAPTPLRRERLGSSLVDMGTLREALRTRLQSWEADLAPEWKDALADVKFDFDGVDEQLRLQDDDVLIPGRRGQPVAGARADSHLFRALDAITPNRVCAVVLGQDPYPNAARATGRSFEQGDLEAWDPSPKKVAESLRRIAQVAAHARTGNAGYLEGDAAWKRVVDDQAAPALRLQAPRALFDHWQSQGVLFLNAAMTLSRFEKPVQEAHFRFWRPFARRILTYLATRPDSHVVFLLWGRVAQDTFKDLGVLDAADAAGTRSRVAISAHSHPAAETPDGAPMFFRAPNAFRDAAQRLEQMGGPKIRW